jgi:diadenosine tetraphosphatase ApaH/serine/threonine PP2A family protein phosphatase
LIRHVIDLLKKEQHTSGLFRVDGRLVLLPSEGEAIIVGDLHGDLESFKHILNDSGFLKKIRKGESVYLIFLGDYGDRGLFSLETFYGVLKLKASFPDNVILIKGNHEGPEDLLPSPHDLPAELGQKYGEEAGARIYAELRNLFNYLYNAALIDDWAVLIHGGLPNEAVAARDLAYAHVNHPSNSHLEDMLWSDPQEELKGVKPSPRGAGKVFGADITRKLLKRLNVKLMIRGHEPCQEGFKINHNGMILTIFSTKKPPYSNKYAAYLQLNLSRKINKAEQLKRCIKQF